jgi:nitrile hydratase subunit alpha
VTTGHHRDHDRHGHHGQVSDVEARALALESLLRERGLVDSRDVDELVSRYEHDVGPMLGARLVARAWLDPAFRVRLLRDANAVLRELGIANEGLNIVVVANEPGVHNSVVCTLCSCYPWPVLGLPPVWYKSAPYRSRMVREPRVVLREFGLDLDDATRVRVWDSSAEQRYLVLPERPAGTEGWSEDELVALVTRDCMIGVARPRAGAG